MPAASRASAGTRASLRVSPLPSPMAAIVKIFGLMPESRIASARATRPSRIVSQTHPQCGVTPARTSFRSVLMSPCRSAFAKTVDGWRFSPECSRCRRRAFTHARQVRAKPSADCAERLNETADNLFPQAVQILRVIMSKNCSGPSLVGHAVHAAHDRCPIRRSTYSMPSGTTRVPSDLALFLAVAGKTTPRSRRRN